MASFEQRIQEQNRATDGGGLGFLEALDQCSEAFREQYKVAITGMLGAKPAEEHLSKCEHRKDDSGEYLMFNPAPGKQEFVSGVDNFDQWLDGKTALKKAGVA
ncbi:MAG: hypothetical protein HY711_08420 [Candidatus Melainabacteria bacterium]|nr:hypothetical protein [Candidatus Melainabacteria bacterium]